MKADNLQKNTGLNANTLKLIAVIAMVVQIEPMLILNVEM